MIFCVQIKDKKTNTVKKTVLETTNHDEAYTIVNEYNKEYGEFSYLLEDYPKTNYIIDVIKKKNK